MQQNLLDLICSDKLSLLTLGILESWTLPPLLFNRGNGPSQHRSERRNSTASSVWVTDWVTASLRHPYILIGELKARALLSISIPLRFDLQSATFRLFLVSFHSPDVSWRALKTFAEAHSKPRYADAKFAENYNRAIFQLLFEIFSQYLMSLVRLLSAIYTSHSPNQISIRPRLLNIHPSAALEHACSHSRCFFKAQSARAWMWNAHLHAV